MSAQPKPRPTPDENAIALKLLRAEHDALEKAYERALDGSRVRQTRIEALTKEGNSLRDQLIGRSLEVERLKGFLAGLRDSEPPPMIPAPRPEPFQDRSSGLWRDPGTPAWYHR